MRIQGIKFWMMLVLVLAPVLMVMLVMTAAIIREGEIRHGRR
jgi:hypothetical protein